jgi:phenylalanine-4-hydroxylase
MIWQWEKSSCFSGPADANSFDMITHMPSSTTIKTKQTAVDDLEVLYQMVELLENLKISMLP